MSISTELLIDVLEIKFHFLGVPKHFGHGSEGENQYWSLFLVQYKKFGIPKIEFDFQNIHWEFKSLCH